MIRIKSMSKSDALDEMKKQKRIMDIIFEHSKKTGLNIEKISSVNDIISADELLRRAMTCAEEKH